MDDEKEEENKLLNNKNGDLNKNNLYINIINI